jgi:murein tripeptide amidase MpaA
MYDCNFYAEGDNCQLYGSEYENDGYTANEACCVCGRGEEPSQSTYETISDYDCFRTVKGTNDTMIALENDFPDLVTIMDIGNSYRVQDPIPEETGYTIRLVKITSPQGVSEKAKVFVVAGVHAREYAPPEIVLRFAEKLAEGYGKDADISWILDHTEIYVLPIANPDGRQIAETDRELLWRKNRHFSGCSESSLDGVDINRNFPFKYGEAGTSDDPCAEKLPW